MTILHIDASDADDFGRIVAKREIADNKQFSFRRNVLYLYSVIIGLLEYIREFYFLPRYLILICHMRERESRKQLCLTL